MNSEERHRARRERRDAKRAANRAKRIEGCDLDAVADFSNLCDAARLAARGVRWKGSVQRYMLRQLRNCSRSRRDLLEGRDVRRGTVEFDVCERGKRRHISAVRFSERVIQKSISRNALTPAIWPTLSPGCSANIEGRGIDYAVRRLKRQLAAHYRRHGSEGWVLLIDFKDYFASIDHGTAKALVSRSLDDEKVVRLVCDQIDSNGERGLGLGSEPNQALAVALPSPIDHMLERTPGIEASGRYMDDTYAVSCDKAVLIDALESVRRECERLGLAINDRKTRIVKLTRGFTFLKRRFTYGGTGKVIVRPCQSTVARARRRLRRQARLVAAGVMPLEGFEQSYQSVRGIWKGMDAHRTLLSYDALHRELLAGIRSARADGGVAATS